MIGGSIVAANLSSHQIIGLMGAAYDRGFIAVHIEWGAILIGFNALLWIFLPFYLRNGFFTVPEYLYKRFGKGARTLYSVLVLFIYIFIEIGSVLYLGALTLHVLLGIPYSISIVILALATGIYTITGGLRAVVWTEIVQLTVLLSGMIILFILTVNAGGGIPAIVESSKHWKMLLPASDPDFPWTMNLGGSLCISVFYCATNQFMVQRALGAKNKWHARMGIVFADYLKFFIPILLVIPALLAANIFTDLKSPDLLFSLLVEKLLPTGLIGLVLSGLVAAMMSHLSGTINSCTTILTVDVYLPYINKKATDAQSVRFGRISGIVVIILGMLCSALLINQSDKPIFFYILSAYGYFTPGIATMFLMGILWKRTTNTGAMAAGFLSVPLAVTLALGFPQLSFMNRTGVVFWICMATCVVVSRMTQHSKGEEFEGLIWSRASLKFTPDERRRHRGLRNPVIWWSIVTGAVLYFFIRYAGF